MKAFITGINGQDGYYLSELCKVKQVEVIGLSRSEGLWTKGDVADYATIENIIRTHRPDYVFHLAANSSTRHDVLFENHETISTGTLNILESVYKHSPGTKVFLSGSAVQFENKGLPINESTPFAPLSPYAVARIQSIYAGRYFRGKGLNVYAGYFFHHDSPLRHANHINQKIVLAVKRIQAGSPEKIEIGDPSVQKEFNFAGDLMEAVWTLMHQDTIHEAVLGNGEPHAISEWLDYCFTSVGKKWEDHVLINTNYASDFRILVSDPSLLFSTGWKPKVSFQQLADLMMSRSTNTNQLKK